MLAGDLSPEDDATDVALTFNNDPPIVVGPVDDVTVDEDAADTVIDLGVVFDDPDLPFGDSLTYTSTVTMPIDRVTAKPLIGPVPKLNSTMAAMKVVMLASAIVDSAFR